MKTRAYEQRVCEVERGSFTPLVMSLTGGLGNAASVCYKRFASLICQAWHSLQQHHAWPGLDVACHSPFFALLSNASGVPAQPLVMQSNSQFLHWILSPPKQGFPPLANFELHMRFQTATHFIYFWIFRCCPPPTPLYIHYRLYWYFVLVKKKNLNQYPQR